MTTEAAVAGRSGTIEAMLPSGTIVTAELVGADNGVAVVRFHEDADIDAASLARKPADELTVVAFGDELTVSSDDLRTLSVPEASPVFDSSGALVGLCTMAQKESPCSRWTRSPTSSLRSSRRAARWPPRRRRSQRTLP